MKKQLSPAAAIAQYEREQKAEAQAANPKKTPRTKKEIFSASIAKVHSTGNATVDKIAQTVLTEAFNRTCATVEETDGYSFLLSRKDQVIKATVLNVKAGKANRKILTIGELQIGGAYAAKAFAIGRSTFKPASSVKANFSEDQVAELASLLAD